MHLIGAEGNRLRALELNHAMERVQGKVKTLTGMEMAQHRDRALIRCVEGKAFRKIRIRSVRSGTDSGGR